MVCKQIRYIRISCTCTIAKGAGPPDYAMDRLRGCKVFTRAFSALFRRGYANESEANMRKTIFALSSGQGKSGKGALNRKCEETYSAFLPFVGVAVVRVSGPGCAQVSFESWPFPLLVLIWSIANGKVVMER